MNINVFSWLLSFFKLRESGKQNLGVKEKMSQSYLSYFFDGVPLENFSFFHGLIDFVLFLVLAWRILESFVSQSFVFSPE